jgi:hypothetical protein
MPTGEPTPGVLSVSDCHATILIHHLMASQTGLNRQK